MFLKRFETFKTNLIEWWELVSDKDNRLLTGFWISCLGGIIAFSFLLNTKTTSFSGIADSRETIISFEFPVVVQRIHIFPGQMVAQGELLAELVQPDLELRVHQLKSQIAQVRAQLQVRSEMTRITLNSKSEELMFSKSQRDPLALQLENLEQELEIVTSRGESLFVFAETAGVIGSVNFKKGETVSPYSPLITLSPESPTFVQGFVYESLHSNVVVGQRLKIVSRAQGSKEVYGRVASIGSRIVPFPVRLSPSPQMQIWGREVMIELAPENHFLLGEKVDVQVDRSWVIFSQALANISGLSSKNKKEIPAQGKTPSEMILNQKQFKNSKLEASGLIFLSDLNKYLMISDDTDDDDSPFLYLLNHDGIVDNQIIKVENIDRFEDLESIFQDAQGNIVLLGSQGESKSKKIKKLRNLLIQVERKGLTLKAKKTLVLRPLLIAALQESKDEELKSLASEAEKTLEIESSGVRNGRLIVGLKHPYDSEGQSLLLELGSLDEILKNESLKHSEVRVAERLRFPIKGQKETWVSDFTFIGEKIYFTTISKTPGRTGRVWEFKQGSFRQLAEYPTFSPEGLAYSPKSNELMIVFDQKDESPRYDKISL